MIKLHLGTTRPSSRMFVATRTFILSFLKLRKQRSVFHVHFVHWSKGLYSTFILYTCTVRWTYSFRPDTAYRIKYLEIYRSRMRFCCLRRWNSSRSLREGWFRPAITKSTSTSNSSSRTNNWNKNPGSLLPTSNRLLSKMIDYSKRHEPCFFFANLYDFVQWFGSHFSLHKYYVLIARPDPTQMMPYVSQFTRRSSKYRFARLETFFTAFAFFDNIRVQLFPRPWT